MGISGYLSVFNDWDLLPATLESVTPFLDELVVVDGAYRWMEPLLASQGIDAARSDQRVYSALETSSCPVRVINATWADELEKRTAGFDACNRRWVLRIDADEDWSNVDFSEVRVPEGRAVGQIEIPLQLTPTMIRSFIDADGDDQPVERLGVLFDSQHVDARAHLSYLWLVLGDEKTRLLPHRSDLVSRDSLGFCSHLANWRTPETSLSRARFYVMNYMRQAGEVHWAPGVTCAWQDGFASIFSVVPPRAFDQYLLTHEIVSGIPPMSSAVVRQVSADNAPSLAPMYDRYLSSLSELNQAIRIEPWAFAADTDSVIDISTDASRSQFAIDNGKLSLRFDAPVAGASATVSSLLDGTAPVHSRLATIEVTNDRVWIELPRPRADALRQTLTLRISDAQQRAFTFLLPD